MSTENTHFMDSWGTYGIQISRFMDRLGYFPESSKSLIRQGFFVDRSGKAYPREDFPLTGVWGIACGTLVHFNTANQFGFDPGRVRIYGRDRQLSAPFVFVCRSDYAASVSRARLLLESVIKETGTISGLPFEIACIEDLDARLSAIEGYVRASL